MDIRRIRLDDVGWPAWLPFLLLCFVFLLCLLSCPASARAVLHLLVPTVVFLHFTFWRPHPTSHRHFNMAHLLFTMFTSLSTHSSCHILFECTSSHMQPLVHQSPDIDQPAVRLPLSFLPRKAQHCSTALLTTSSSVSLREIHRTGHPTNSTHASLPPSPPPETLQPS